MGAHGDDHGHHEIKIPDYKIYKIDECPELIGVQRALAAKGLRDPWLRYFHVHKWCVVQKKARFLIYRNEAWRFDAKLMLTHSQRFRGFFFRGFKYGFGAFLLTIAGEAVYNRLNPSEHHGHH